MGYYMYGYARKRPALPLHKYPYPNKKLKLRLPPRSYGGQSRSTASSSSLRQAGALVAAKVRNRRRRPSSFRPKSVYADAGKFKGPIKPRYASEYLKRGSVFKIESGSVLTDAECCYIGHTTHPVKYVMTGFGRALARHICERFWHFHIERWDQNVGGNNLRKYFRCEIRYLPQIGSGSITTTTTFSVSSSSYTYSQFAENLIDGIMGIVLASAGNQQPVFQSLLIEKDSTPLVTDMTISPVYIDLAQVVFKVRGASYMRLQNRTASATGGTEDHTSALDVANNPLRGKQYFCRGSTFNLCSGTARTNDFPNFSFQSGSGLFALGSQSASFSAQTQVALSKPPPSSAFMKVTGTRFVRLQPGQIKVSRLVKEESHTINTWVKRLQNTFREGNRGAGIGDTEAMEFNNVGLSSLFAMEKMCDTKVSEPDVQIGYEHNVTVSVVCYTKRAATQLPEVVIIT